MFKSITVIVRALPENLPEMAEILGEGENGYVARDQSLYALYR